MNIVFGPIYPYTFGTWVGVGFWWLAILSVVIAIVAALRTPKDNDEKNGGANGE